MNVKPPEAPEQLTDAWARIEQAHDNYLSLGREIQLFWREQVRGMLRGFDGETGNFIMRLPHPSDSEVRGKPKVLLGQVVENLRSALDYMVFELSKLNAPALNPRTPQFVIATTETDFRRQAKGRLKYLTDEQKSFIEEIQPYQGNSMLGLLGKMAGTGKHRRLHAIRDAAGFDIYFSPMAKKGEYQGCFTYSVGKGQAVFARPKTNLKLLLMDKYDATGLMKSMVEHVAEIVAISSCFFEGRPLKLTIVRDS